MGCTCSGSAPTVQKEAADEVDVDVGRGDAKPARQRSLRPEEHSVVIDSLWALLTEVWPTVDRVVQGVVHRDVVPRVNMELPAGLKLSIEHFSLGGAPFSQKPTFVLDRKEGKGFDLFVPVVLKSNDLKVAVKLGCIPLGIEELSLKLELMVFVELLEGSPVLGALTVSLLEMPEIDFKVSGLADIAEVPQIKGLIMKQLDDAIGKDMVIPNRLTPFVAQPHQGVDIARAKYPPPIGILRVKVVSASDLRRADVLDKNDPYVKVGVGYSKFHWSTKVAKAKEGEDNIVVWKEEQRDFMVWSLLQRVQVVVWDGDFWTADDKLGEVPNLRVSQAIKEAEQDLKLLYEGSESGAVKLSFDWLNLSPGTSLATAGLPCVLVVFVDKLIVERRHEDCGAMSISAKLIAPDQESREESTAFQSRVPDSAAEELYAEKVCNRLCKAGYPEEFQAEISGLSVSECRQLREKAGSRKAVPSIREFIISSRLYFLHASSKFESAESLEISVLEQDKGSIATKTFSISSMILEADEAPTKEMLSDDIHLWMRLSLLSGIP
eukprot:TRINITY_DN27642_c0_g1_i1.p1 TRINITY_DN27642_c0_g1~~TRINITY_DN27642_c0_g1_i1.p1  ORF type:complete len:550 (+),score=129.52 TRINITY_DN27642_c0_g1_i1:23-1672(+)